MQRMHLPKADFISLLVGTFDLTAQFFYFFAEFNSLRGFRFELHILMSTYSFLIFKNSVVRDLLRVVHLLPGSV